MYIGLGTSDVVVTAITSILLGFVILIFCLFIFFIIFCRKDKEEEVMFSDFMNVTLRYFQF